MISPNKTMIQQLSRLLDEVTRADYCNRLPRYSSSPLQSSHEIYLPTYYVAFLDDNLQIPIF